MSQNLPDFSWKVYKDIAGIDLTDDEGRMIEMMVGFIQSNFEGMGKQGAILLTLEAYQRIRNSGKVDQFLADHPEYTSHSIDWVDEILSVKLDKLAKRKKDWKDHLPSLIKYLIKKDHAFEDDAEELIHLVTTRRSHYRIDQLVWDWWNSGHSAWLRSTYCWQSGDVNELNALKEMIDLNIKFKLNGYEKCSSTASINRETGNLHMGTMYA